MENCAKHFCPLILTHQKSLVCPVGWTLERFERNRVKDVLIDEDLFELVFNDGISLIAYGPTVQNQAGQWSLMNLDAEDYLDAFSGSRVTDVAHVFDDPGLGIYYLQIGLTQAVTSTHYGVIVEFYSLLDEASPYTRHFIGGSNGKK